MKRNKTEYIHVRVTTLEKDYLQKQAKKTRKRFSKYVRIQLGLENNTLASNNTGTDTIEEKL